MTKTTLTTTAALLTLGVASQAAAQNAEVTPLSEWNPMSMSEGWSADRLMDLPVRGAGGDEIGEVENIVLGPDGNVKGLILEVGGFLDIGDTHFMVPWDQVEVDPSGELAYVSVPIAEDNYDSFDISASSGDVETGPREFRATELMGDYVSLSDTPRYGYVSDLVFDADGMLQTVVVSQNSVMGGGYYGYPYYGYDYGFEPGMDTYDLPYDGSEIGDLDPYDYAPMMDAG